jgi:hypothetical protein
MGGQIYRAFFAAISFHPPILTYMRRDKVHLLCTKKIMKKASLLQFLLFIYQNQTSFPLLFHPSSFDIIFKICSSTILKTIQTTSVTKQAVEASSTIEIFWQRQNISFLYQTTASEYYCVLRCTVAVKQEL